MSRCMSVRVLVSRAIVLTYSYERGSQPPDTAEIIGITLSPVCSSRSGASFVIFLFYTEAARVYGFAIALRRLAH